jgi:predicted ATPase
MFIGTFTLEAATYVIADIFGSPFEAADGIAGLVSKSLVGIEGAGGAVRYRMLETVRLYVLERLDASALRSVQRRHLAFYQLLMQRAAAAWEASETDEWLAEYGADIDNVRAALQWGFSPTGDASLSAALAAAATPLWRELSLHSECRRWAELALGTSDTPGTARELALLIAYGSTLLNTGGDDARVEAMLRRALSLAETLKQQEYILRAGYSLWVHFLHRNDYRAAFNQAAQFRVNARRASDLTDMLIGNRMVGARLHYLGRQGAARWWLERALRQPMAAAQRSREARFGVDQRVAALTATARVRALQGQSDQAMAAARQAVAAVDQTSRIASLCHALGELCVVALWIGCQETVEAMADRLFNLVEHYGLHFWRPHALVLQGSIAALRGNATEAAAKFDAARETAPGSDFDLLYPSLVGPMAEGELIIGREEQAFALIDQALDRTWGDERWYSAELSRLRGVLRLVRDGPDAARLAEAPFLRAVEQARRGSALALELRATTSLSVQIARRGDTVAATEILAKVYNRFTEGFDTIHLRSARDLLVGWRDLRPEAMRTEQATHLC